MNFEETSTTKEFFFDTYAFIEILKGNENYKPYKNSGLTTTKLNLFELYLFLLRENNENNAEIELNKYYPFAIDFDEEVIKEAANLKIKLSKREVSLTDCIGYSLAKQMGIPFLTGDAAFHDLDNVEFVI